jgi:hypothetical protein
MELHRRGERLMARPDELVAAALFEHREPAEEAWGRLVEADIPASVITEPGIMGAFYHRVMVERADLERAQSLIADLVAGQG